MRHPASARSRSRIPQDHRRRDRVPLGRDAPDPARARASGCAPPRPRSGSRRPRATGTGCARSRALRERQAADRRAVGTVDVIGLAVERRARRGAALPAARRSARRPIRLPPRERRGAGSRDDPRVVLPRALRRRADDPTADRRPARHRRHGRARGVPRRSPRARGWRCGRRSAARSGGSPSSRTRTPGWRSSTTRARPSSGASDASRRSSSSASRSTSRACRSGSSASTSRTSRGARSSPRCRCSSTASRGARTTGRSRCAASRARTTSPRWPRSSSAGSRGFATQRRPSGHDESFAALPNLVVIDGGKGQLSAALEAIHATYDLPARGGRRAREARRGGLRPRSLRPDPARAPRPGLATSPACSGRGTPLRARLPPSAPRHAGVRVDLRRPRGHRAGASARDPASLRVGGLVPRRDPGGARGRARGCRRRRPAPCTPSSTRRGARERDRLREVLVSSARPARGDGSCARSASPHSGDPRTSTRRVASTRPEAPRRGCCGARGRPAAETFVRHARTRCRTRRSRAEHRPVRPGAATTSAAARASAEPVQLPAFARGRARASSGPAARPRCCARRSGPLEVRLTLPDATRACSSHALRARARRRPRTTAADGRSAGASRRSSAVCGADICSWRTTHMPVRRAPHATERRLRRLRRVNLRRVSLPMREDIAARPTRSGGAGVVEPSAGRRRGPAARRRVRTRPRRPSTGVGAGERARPSSTTHAASTRLGPSPAAARWRCRAGRDDAPVPDRPEREEERGEADDDVDDGQHELHADAEREQGRACDADVAEGVDDQRLLGADPARASRGRASTGSSSPGRGGRCRRSAGCRRRRGRTRRSPSRSVQSASCQTTTVRA